ncbi:PAS domain-containing protein [Methanohalobium sp.]|uniref:PAS domain-containing protein n=1 Tax=Methanohalobium sp. TaxID=2837493 RepID=UPI0025E8B7D3|nr:PAS domain-containing protein [Methanohalobium sp.]
MDTKYFKRSQYYYQKYRDVPPENIAYESALDDIFEIQSVVESFDKDNNSVVFLWKSEDGWPVEYVSNNIEKFGYSPDEFITGKLKYEDIIHPDDLKDIKNKLDYTFNNNNTFSKEYRIITKLSEVKWVNETSYFHSDENHNITFYKGVITDITGQKNKEVALNNSLELRNILQKVIDNSPFIVFLWKFDRNWPAVYVSNNVSQLGYAPQDFTSGHVKHDSIIHTDDLERVRFEFSKLCRVGFTDFTQEYRILTKQGKIRWVNEEVIVQYNDKSSPVSYQSIMFDITDRKNKEVALQHSLKEKKNFENIINQSPVVVFQWKASDNLDELWPVEYVSDNVSQFGYSPNEFVKGEIQYGDIIYSEDLDQVQLNLHEQRKKGYSEFSQEYRIITRKGYIRWVDERTIIHRNDDGEPESYQGIILDNSKHRYAEKIINVQHKIGSLLNSDYDTDEAIDKVLDHILEINTIDCVCIHFVDESGGLDLINHKGLSLSLVHDISHINSNSFITKILMTGNPIYKDYSEIFFNSKSISNSKQGERALAIIPVKFKGEIIAALSVSSHTHDNLPQEVRIAIENIADLLGGFIGRITIEIELGELPLD